MASTRALLKHENVSYNHIKTAKINLTQQIAFFPISAFLLDFFSLLQSVDYGFVGFGFQPSGGGCNKRDCLDGLKSS